VAGEWLLEQEEQVLSGSWSVDEGTVRVEEEVLSMKGVMSERCWGMRSK
jgi:hypothetical protein